MPAFPCPYHSRFGAFHWKCSWRWSLYAPWPIIITGTELPKAKSNRSCLILCPWPNHHQWGMLENQWEKLKGVIVESFQRSSIRWERAGPVSQKTTPNAVLPSHPEALWEFSWVLFKEGLWCTMLLGLYRPNSQRAKILSKNSLIN